MDTQAQQTDLAYIGLVIKNLRQDVGFSGAMMDFADDHANKAESKYAWSLKEAAKDLEKMRRCLDEVHIKRMQNNIRIAQARIQQILEGGEL